MYHREVGKISGNLWTKCVGKKGMLERDTMKKKYIKKNQVERLLQNVF